MSKCVALLGVLLTMAAVLVLGAETDAARDFRAEMAALDVQNLATYLAAVARLGELVCGARRLCAARVALPFPACTEAPPAARGRLLDVHEQGMLDSDEPGDLTALFCSRRALDRSVAIEVQRNVTRAIQANLCSVAAEMAADVMQRLNKIIRYAYSAETFACLMSFMGLLNFRKKHDLKTLAMETLAAAIVNDESDDNSILKIVDIAQAYDGHSINFDLLKYQNFYRLTRRQSKMQPSLVGDVAVHVAAHDGMVADQLIADVARSVASTPREDVYEYIDALWEQPYQVAAMKTLSALVPRNKEPALDYALMVRKFLRDRSYANLSTDEEAWFTDERAQFTECLANAVFATRVCIGTGAGDELRFIQANATRRVQYLAVAEPQRAPPPSGAVWRVDMPTVSHEGSTVAFAMVPEDGTRLRVYDKVPHRDGFMFTERSKVARDARVLLAGTQNFRLVPVGDQGHCYIHQGLYFLHVDAGNDNTVYAVNAHKLEKHQLTTWRLIDCSDRSITNPH